MPLEESEQEELGREIKRAYPTRKIRTPVPVEWMPKTNKPKVMANTLMNVMLKEGR